MSPREEYATTMAPVGPISFRFEPDAGQRNTIAQYIGAARFAYNWVLYANRTNERLAGAELRERFRDAVESEAVWLSEVPPTIVESALREAERELAECRKTSGRRPRYRRKDDQASVRIDSGDGGFKVGQGGIALPGIGKLTLIGTARIASSVDGVVVVRVGEEWFLRLPSLPDRGGSRDRDRDRGRGRDQAAAPRRETERVDVNSLPESVTLVRDGVTHVGRAAPVQLTGWEALEKWIA